MHKPKDLTGLSFGELTVIKRLPNANRNRHMWLCRCSCGEEVIKRGDSLKSDSKCAAHNVKTEIGNKYNKLTIIDVVSRNKLHTYLCKCDCGNVVEVEMCSVKSGHTKSCGCLMYSKPKLHDMSNTPEYNIWTHMKQRCFNPRCRDYKDYGGRGITVCERWLDFKNFFEDMGYKCNKKSIDRINVDGNYEPSNCRWATDIQQANNRRSNNVITYNGITMNLTQWAHHLNIKRSTLSNRYRNGLRDKELFKPIKGQL